MLRTPRSNRFRSIVKAASASGSRKGPAPTGRRKILLIQGPNMGYLGKREPELYGRTTAAELDQNLRAHAQSHGYDLEIFYSNVEGFAVDKVYDAVEKGVHGIVMNPAGFTYGGYSIRDALIPA
ncbi:TPA: type II 3-dehydroquinate dehydratase [Stenotrophomonas maltophilia]|uniref:type II 3-dehydroquinate dehydratase n=2 Tax=Stenotrophomonas maltophilia TaxID=40324 RepID=UPI00106FAE10|nr:type II 3-dehydroquinate dehydratase [Stenotrophomonas maltophilia]MBA0228786.1 3-dehydroquinate dehydratase [Stenotrophomonas maltophilia]